MWVVATARRGASQAEKRCMFASSRPIAPRARRRLRRAATLHVRATTAPTDQRPKSPHRWRRGADGMRRRTKGGALRAPCVAHRFAAAPSPTTSSLPERRHSSSSRRRANAPAMLFSLRRTSTRVDNSFNTPSQPSGTYTEDRADRSRIFRARFARGPKNSLVYAQICLPVVLLFPSTQASLGVSKPRHAAPQSTVATHSG